MEPEIIKIQLFDKREQITTGLYVQQLSEDTFRMTENELFNCRLTYGTEFKTRINKNGEHEIVKIINDSNFVTRRFFLSAQFKESEYRVLGDEIMRQGGFWQVDFGSIATINLPKDCELDMDDIFKTFDFKPGEIVD